MVYYDKGSKYPYSISKKLWEYFLPPTSNYDLKLISEEAKIYLFRDQIQKKKAKGSSFFDIVNLKVNDEKVNTWGDLKKVWSSEDEVKNINPLLLQNNIDSVHFDGISVEYQTSNTKWDSNNDRRGYITSKEGRPFVKIGQFKIDRSTNKYTFISGIVLNHTDEDYKEMYGFREIMAPIVNGMPNGNGVMYKWGDPGDDAFTFKQSGFIKGINFADGIVTGYNIEGVKSQDCTCRNYSLTCRNLLKTVADKKFDDFALAAGILFVTGVEALSIVARNLPPREYYVEKYGSDCGCSIKSIKDEGWFSKNGYDTVTFENGSSSNIKYSSGKWRVTGWIFDDTYNSYQSMIVDLTRKCINSYCPR